MYCGRYRRAGAERVEQCRTPSGNVLSLGCVVIIVAANIVGIGMRINLSAN